MQPKIVIPRANSKHPQIRPPDKKLQDKRWTFSFQYWRQHENFGLQNEKVDVVWFTSLITRLKELSSKTIEEVTTNRSASSAWRYHKLNWEQPNMPITKEEFESFLPSGTLNEETEVCQFMISQANGRVVGFFDHVETFQIVLLDPLHNIQPAKDYNYAVNPTQFALTAIELHQERLISIKKSADEKCGSTACDLKHAMEALMGHGPGRRYFCLNDILQEHEIYALTEKHGSIEGVVLEALSQLSIQLPGIS